MTTEQITAEAEARYTQWDNMYLCSRRAFQAGAEWLQGQNNIGFCEWIRINNIQSDYLGEKLCWRYNGTTYSTFELYSIYQQSK